MAKLNIAPTKSHLLEMKAKLAVSENGYDLLEQKREILVMELMRLVQKISLLQNEIDALAKDAYASFRKMLSSMGSDSVVRIAHGVRYDFHMKEAEKTIAGMTFKTLDVDLPQQELFYSELGTSSDSDRAIIKLFELLSRLTEMASVRTIAWRLANEVKKTQRRVNALDKIVIPQTKETKQYIEGVLEERDRENVFVLKSLKNRGEKGANE